MAAIKVTLKSGTVLNFEDVTMANFIYCAPEWDLDFDSMIKIEVV